MVSFTFELNCRHHLVTSMLCQKYSPSEGTLHKSETMLATISFTILASQLPNIQKWYSTHPKMLTKGLFYMMVSILFVAETESRNSSILVSHFWAKTCSSR